MTFVVRRTFSGSWRHIVSSRAFSSSGRPVASFVNASRLDYDGQLDFSRLIGLCDLTCHPLDWVEDPDEFLEKVQGAEIVITKELKVPEEVLERFPDSVRLLCEAGTGYNNVPVQVARARGIAVCNVPEYSTHAVAHMAITYLMNLSIHMFEQQIMLSQNDRSNFTKPFGLPLEEINGKTIGLVGGAGRIGSQVAEIALALGMNVIISSRAGKLPKGHKLEGHPRVKTTSCVEEELLPLSDYVSIHTPLNDETRGSFGRAQIERMKPTAFLINTSRGAVCNEEELIACLKEGVLRGAGLDVTVGEPPLVDSELWTLPNVWLSPHIGWRRKETRQRLIDMTADNIEAYMKAQSDQDLINVVN